MIQCCEGKAELASGPEFDFAARWPHRLLELLSPYAADDFLAGIYPGDFTGGRRPGVSAGQLRRTRLLAVWTATHSLNLVVA